MNVLMLDIGGSNVKMMISAEGEMRKLPTGNTFTPEELATGVRSLTADWTYDQISIGFPSRIRNGKPDREPLNLGGGWLAFDYEKAFGKPVRFMNDAAMQALGNYASGRLLFVGFGTSIGTALIVDDLVIPIEIGERLITHARFMEKVTKAALKRGGRKRWTKAVHNAIGLLQDIFFPDETIIGGGNASVLDLLPPNCRCVTNQSAYVGAQRLWEGADLFAAPGATSWRIHRTFV